MKYTVEYIKNGEAYAYDNFIEGAAIEDCAQYVMNWCTINNHDLSTIPLPALERIIKMYYHSVE